MTPNDLSREHAALVKAAVDGKLNRRQLMVRGMAIGLSATALAGLMSAYRSPAAVAQSPVAGAQDNALSGQTIDMTILGIAGWPPSRLGVDHGDRAVQALCQGDLRLRRQLLLRGGAVRVALPEGRHLAAVRFGPVQHHHLRQPVAGRPGRAGLDRPAQRHHRREPRARHRVRGGRGDRLPDLPGRLRPDLGLPAGGRHHRPLRAPGSLLRPGRARRLQGGQRRRGSAADLRGVGRGRHRPLRADRQHFTRPDENLYGTAIQWSKVYDFVSCYAYPFMFSTGGEVWDPATGQVEGILDSEINAAGLERNKSFLQYAPPGATNYGIAEEVDVFTSGTIATCFQWSALGPQMLNQLAGRAGRSRRRRQAGHAGHGPDRAVRRDSSRPTAR